MTVAIDPLEHERRLQRKVARAAEVLVRTELRRGRDHEATQRCWAVLSELVEKWHEAKALVSTGTGKKELCKP